MHTPETPTVNFKRSGLSNQLQLCASYFDRINEGSLRIHGSSLVELSKLDPAVAYQYLRRAVAIEAINYTLDVSDNGKIVAHADFSSQEEVGRIAHDKILDAMPAEYEGPFLFGLSIYPSPEDVMFGMAPNEAIPIMDLLVEPPSLSY